MLVSERLDFEFVKDDDANDAVASEYRNAKFRANRVSVSQRVTILRICLEVRNMNRPSLEPTLAVMLWRPGVMGWRLMKSVSSGETL